MAPAMIIPLAASALVLLFTGTTDATCAAGYKDCDKDYKLNQCEVHILTDVNNCGNCGVKCPTYPYALSACNAGKCVVTCKPGWKNCNDKWSDGCETDVGKDANNCGSCGTKCNALVPYAFSRCNNHKCKYTCKAGWKDCNCNMMKDGCEVDVGKDINNCGKCGMKCKDVPYAASVCNGGKCEYTCEEGWANCNDDWEDGCETDINTDVNNCGACATVCTTPKFWGGEAKCSDGVCDKQWCIKGWKYSDE